MQPVTLHTKRLELSTPVASDADAIHDACQDADIQRYTTVPSPYEHEHATGFIALVAQWWEDDREYTWAIREGGVLAGVIGLHRHGRDTVEIGYWMAAGSRGRGLLTEAATAVIDWAFSADGLCLPRIEWRAVVGNVASARAARALGFRYEGMLRHGLAQPRGRTDGWIAGLLPGDDRTPQPWPVLP